MWFCWNTLNQAQRQVKKSKIKSIKNSSALRFSYLKVSYIEPGAPDQYFSGKIGRLKKYWYLVILFTVKVKGFLPKTPKKSKDFSIYLWLPLYFFCNPLQKIIRVIKGKLKSLLIFWGVLEERRWLWLSLASRLLNIFPFCKFFLKNYVQEY